MKAHIRKRTRKKSTIKLEAGIVRFASDFGKSPKPNRTKDIDFDQLVLGLGLWLLTSKLLYLIKNHLL